MEPTSKSSSSAANLPQSIFIAGLSSDIGKQLASNFAAEGSKVAGTYRNLEAALESAQFIYCDLSIPSTIPAAVRAYEQTRQEPWDLYVSSVGSLDPIGSFFSVDTEEWSRSVEVNSIRQLELLKGLYPFRNKGMAHVAFFAGAGTNGPAPAYSAYSASKIFLIKMCELLHAENEDLNCFIIGPGVVRTKIHDQTLAAGGRAGTNLKLIRGFLESDDPGVSHKGIYECLKWCVEAGRDAVGGRNISLVGDVWQTRGPELAGALRQDPEAFRLRRHANELLKQPTK